MIFPKLRLQARRRAFTIWQKLGYLPWSRPKNKNSNGDFYKGAFDSIPFLNADAKRTFVHLLLRPGYMIRDYINGQHERYLAPLTSLIIFYAFFALISSIVHPDFNVKKEAAPTVKEETVAAVDSVTVTKGVRWTDLYLFSLDKHPELVDTPAKASIAALERSVNSISASTRSVCGLMVQSVSRYVVPAPWM